jgi:hypothetical protein
MKPFSFNLLDFYSSRKKTVKARNLIDRLKEDSEDLPLQLTEFLNSSDNEDTLLSWAQSFCNIDVDHDQFIQEEELKNYVRTHYRSAMYLKKDIDQVVASALKHFKAAVRENESDSDESIGSLTFKLFFKMMHQLHSVRKDAIGEADFKLYEFLRSTSAKSAASRDDDDADKNAKVIEKAAGLVVGGLVHIFCTHDTSHISRTSHVTHRRVAKRHRQTLQRIARRMLQA